jgi:Rrf2 family protein
VSLRSLHGVLTQLTRSGLLVSQRGAHGGYKLARPATAVTVADVVRAVDGPVEDGASSEAAGSPSGILAEVWNALRASELAVLEAVTLADLAAGRLPDAVHALTWGGAEA